MISWSLWRYAWTPTEVSDDVRVYVRAINARGERQIEEFRDQVPHGALGLHWVRGRVVAADATTPKVASVERPAASPRTALCHRGNLERMNLRAHPRAQRRDRRLRRCRR